MPSLAETARRYACLGRAVLRARRGPFDPFKLTWIVTERCSLRCRTCHLWATGPDAGPDLEVAARVLARNRHLTWLNLSGGDLVERHDAPRLLELVARELPDLALLDFPTAGQDTDATLAALEPVLASEIPRVYVTVSLDGPDAVHDRLRGRDGAAEAARTTYRALRRVRRRGFHVAAGMTLSRHNLDARALSDPGSTLPEGIPVEDLHLNLAVHSSHYYRNHADVTPPVAAARAVMDHVHRERPVHRLSPLDAVERRYWRVARRYLERGETDIDCGALRAQVFLAADLTVYPCSVFDRPLGNLRDVDFDLRRVAELPGAAGALSDVEKRACPRCWSPCEAFPTLLLALGRTR